MSKTGVSLASFARVMGVDRAQPTRWVQSGLPLLPDGSVDPADGAEWVRKHVRDYARRRNSIGASQMRRTASVPPDSASSIEAISSSFPDVPGREVAIAHASSDAAAAVAAAELLLPHLPEALVRSTVAELFAKLAVGTIECLDHEYDPPPGCASWGDYLALRQTSPTEAEWQEMLAERAAIQPVPPVPKAGTTNRRAGDKSASQRRRKCAP